jgi:hypothetical protein
MFLAKLLELHPGGGLDFNVALKSLKRAKWNRDYVSKKGGGWNPVDQAGANRGGCTELSLEKLSGRWAMRSVGEGW